MSSEQPQSKSRIKRYIVSRLSIRPPVDDDPRLLSRTTKGIILFCLAITGGSSGFTSTIYFPGIPNIMADLQAPSMVTTLLAALFILFMGITPVFWASMSDFYHVRKFPILVAMIIFSVASLGSSFVNNIWALVVLRCIQSAGSSCGQSVCAGVIADCYPLEKRGSAFGKFFFGMFIGPLLGPIVGGFLIMSPIGWRSTFWFCFALGIFIFVLCFCCLPETYRDNEKFDKELPVVTDSKSAASSATDVQSIPEKVLIKRKNINPIAPFLLLRHPFVFLASFVSGIAFGSMFAIETVIPEIYEKKYGFSSWQTGLSFLGAGVGNFLGSSLNGYLSDRLLMRARAKRGGQAMVEDRLTANLWPAGIFFIPLGLLMFGFMAEYQVSVWGSIVGFGIQCFGMNMLLTSTSAYLVDAMPGQGASATAAGVLVRMTMSCVLTLVANPMVAALGIGYTTVLLSGLSLLSMVMLLVLKMRGEQLRRWSGYA